MVHVGVRHSMVNLKPITLFILIALPSPFPVLADSLPFSSRACKDVYRIGGWHNVSPDQAPTPPGYLAVNKPISLSRSSIGGHSSAELKQGVGCPNLNEMSIPETLLLLETSDYYCTESIAVVLASRADDGLITNLLNLINTHSNGWARRNAMRVIGRFAERGSSHPAGSLVLIARGPEIQTAILDRLENDSDEDLLHDAIWVADSYFFPYHAVYPSLKRISANQQFDTTLRFRAMLAIERLIHNRDELLLTSDLDFILGSLISDDLWVRAEAAFICERLTDNHIGQEGRVRVIAELTGAYIQESEFVPKFYMSRSLDHFNGNNDLVTDMRNDYEAAHLPDSLTAGGITIRARSHGDLSLFVDMMSTVKNAFFDLFNHAFDSPVPGDPNQAMTLMLFDNPDVYEDFMNTFVGFGAYAGGLYIESSGTLYTYRRTPSQSSHTVEDLVKHEYGHYLQARYLYPGLWGDSGYFDQPRGWADEGLAEFLAGLKLGQGGHYRRALRPVYMTSVCQSVGSLDLNALIRLRAGYDETGTFNYRNAWLFSHYLMAKRPDIALRLYSSYRDGTYNVDNFTSIATVSSLEDLETDWKNKATGWCNAQETDTLTTQGGIFSVETTRGPTEVVVPAGTVSVDTPITLFDISSFPGGNFHNATPLNLGLEIRLGHQGQLKQPATIRLYYDDSHVVGLNESLLSLARYDGIDGDWLRLVSNNQTNANRVSAQTNELSLHQLVLSPPPDPVSPDPPKNARVFPNPFRPTRGDTEMRFSHLPAGSRIKIYSMTGDLIQVLNAPLGLATWTGRNQSDEAVASGIYLALIDGAEEKFILKIALLR